MPSVWKKTMTYLGLVEDDEFEQLDEATEAEGAPIRRIQRPQAVRIASDPHSEGVVRTIPSPRPASTGPSTSPSLAGSTRRWRWRTGSRGTAVIMNLQSTDDAIARRLVDFASGLVYGLDKEDRDGRQPRVSADAGQRRRPRPRNERIAGGAFYNQF